MIGMVVPPRTRHLRLAICLLLVCQTAASGQSVRASVVAPTCGLYIAESTIPNAGLGTFTGKPREKGEQVDHGDLCIPLIYFKYYSGKVKTFKEYYWKGRAVGMYFETYNSDIQGLCNGLGAIVNSYFPIVNLEEGLPDYEDSQNFPGIGAVSPYHNHTSVTRRAIPEGGELFIQYVDSWFTTREKLFGKIPLFDDYPKAQKLLRKFLRVVDYAGSVRQEWQNDLYELIKSIGQGAWESRLLNALPQTLAEARIAAQDDGMTKLYQPNATRSLEWLEQNGRCTDHIRPGHSDEAGRGALAVRALPKGTIVATSPLHVLPNGRRDLLMYPLLKHLPNWLADYVKPVVFYTGLFQRKQLVWNYCWGHAESPVMLYPYASSVQLINHSSERPNVRIRWSRGFPIAHNHQLVRSSTVQDLEDQERPLLSLDYVAMRDIQPGEEILIDYGPAWEEAWKAHLASISQTSNYKSATDMNRQQNRLLTSSELKENPYPSNVHLRCHKGLRVKDSERPDEFIWRPDEPGFECRVTRRTDGGENLYRVRLHIEQWETREQVPREAIRFFDEPHTTQLHWSNAFRHEMHIPDHLFPSKWKYGKEPNYLGIIVVTLVFLYELYNRCFRS